MPFRPSLSSALPLVAALLGGCGGSPEDPDNGAADSAVGDGGGTPDGGAADGAVGDGGGTPDSGARPDAGSGTPDGGGTPDSGGTAFSPYVDPACTDGRWTETLPDRTASLADIPFSASDVPAFVDAALDRRYPLGAALVRGGRTNTSFGDCSVLFSGSPTRASDAYRALDTIVHECGHLFDLQLSRSGSGQTYVITNAVRFTCSRGDTTARGGDTFARSLITRDAYSAMRPPCNGGSTAGCDNYADIYLNGSPTDGTFDSGDQGFNFLHEETVQYVNSLASAWTYEDQLPTGQRTSARDGILTFLWYTERYLRMARLEHPAAYTRISGDACWRDAVLSVWGRAWLYLSQTEGQTALGIADAQLLALVTAPELLEEIDRLRTAAGCP